MCRRLQRERNIKEGALPLQRKLENLDSKSSVRKDVPVRVRALVLQVTKGLTAICRRSLFSFPEPTGDKMGTSLPLHWAFDRRIWR